MTGSKVASADPNTLDKIDFMEYVRLPGPLSERLFQVAAWNSKKENLSCDQFVKVMFRIFGDLHEQNRLAFEMFDFDDDGFVSKIDVQLVLGCLPTATIFDAVYSNLCSEAETWTSQNKMSNRKKEQQPLTGNTAENHYVNWSYLQECIEKFVNETFYDDEPMTFEQFKHLFYSKNSVLTVVIMATILNNLPCSIYCLEKKSEFWETQVSKTPNLKFEKDSLAPTVKIAFPKLGNLQEKIPQTLSHFRFIILKTKQKNKSNFDVLNHSPIRAEDDNSSVSSNN